MPDEPILATPAGDAPGGDADAVAAQAAADAKIAEDAAAKAAADGKPNGEDKADALISYEPFQMPDGMQADQEMLKAFTPLAQKSGLKQEDAQSLVDLFADKVKKQAEAHTAEWGKAMQAWQDEAKADKDIGGDKWDATQANVALAKEKLGTEALGNILDVTGVGNNVEMIRLLDKVGKIIGDDTLDIGGALGEAPRSRSEIMYPKKQGQ